MKIENYKIGSDPEAFILNEKSNIVSSLDLIPGDKQDPYPIGEGCAIQHDNILAEWCVPPTRDPATFSQSIDHCVSWTEDILPQGFKIAFMTSFHVDVDQLLDPRAQEFGCEPDYNAWSNGEPNTKPNCDTNLRTAGGHIHIGYDNSTHETNMSIIKALDLFLAVPALFLDNDKLRRSLYGKSGAFRHKSYGVEYRSLSNFWVNDPMLVIWVFNQIDVAIDFVNCGGTMTDEDVIHIQLAVNEGDLDLAELVMHEYGISIPELIK